MTHLISFGWHYGVLVLVSWFGIALLIVGVLQLGEWAFDKKVPIPIWVRLSIMGALLFFAQASVYRKLADEAPTVINFPGPFRPSP